MIRGTPMAARAFSPAAASARLARTPPSRGLGGGLPGRSSVPLMYMPPPEKRPVERVREVVALYPRTLVPPTRPRPALAYTPGTTAVSIGGIQATLVGIEAGGSTALTMVRADLTAAPVVDVSDFRIVSIDAGQW